MDDLIFRMLPLKKQGYCCSQILILLALEEQGKTNPDLVRAMGGLCWGVAMSGEICGALSGGACLLSLYTAKGEENDRQDDRYASMMADFAAWFHTKIAAEYGGIRCDDILARYPDKSICATLVSATYEKVMEILVAYGIDPIRGKID